MPRESSPDPVLAALRQAGSRIRRVRYRLNRSVLLSVSRDGGTLNSHECFRDAPARVVDAIVTFVSAPRRSPAHRRALTVIRNWEGSGRGLAEGREVRPRRAATRGGAEEALLRPLFDRLNGERFLGGLPAIPLRLSRRMTRTLGTIAYGSAGDRRTVREIALNADLLLPANASVLVDTLLHEMAHAEAWLRHGHRGHGAVWRRIAERVGCEPRALARLRVARRARAG
jgi:hypothetical protein